ncbi:MAG: hypothetical protein NT127_07690 [Sphingobacteriales bacterium]|nr:hypothetical protein [Sphingobacteriales bacterium]
MAQSFINDVDVPLGLRNNNPGNIRDVGIGWEGKIGSNKGFVVFDDVAWGIRAMIINFHTSITIHRNDTLRKYITRYAPPQENDTEQYIKIVSQKTGIESNEKIEYDFDKLKLILLAQFDVEIGPQYSSLITNEDVHEAFSRLNFNVASFFNCNNKFKA